MSVLRPHPFAALVARQFGELRSRRAIFDLPERKFFLGEAARDLSVRLHGQRAATALGPAAGPQSQMAQNIVLSWLGGSRIVELKTVQIDDELDLPRPCIDMQTVGYNVEWSQELKLEESLEEYVKGAMLVTMLAQGGELALEPGFADTLFDMSVGYGLEGIRSPRVQEFIRGMQDAGPIVDRLRGQIPSEFAALRDLEYPRRLSSTLTLSTFHGCPSDEIEGIVDFLLRHHGLHCIVKLNPMLLGPAAVRGLLNDALGYEDVRVPDSAFENDTTWSQAVDFVGRLGDTATALGLGFGVKFTNTLIVENHRDFFPASEKQMYLSGPPLHVLAMHLVGRFRETFGDRHPISFSAGIDRGNFADAVALGLVPVTVCSDLLKPGGYGRSRGYLDAQVQRMEACGARDVDEWILRAYGHALPALDGLGVARDDPRRIACERALGAGEPLEPVAGPELFPRWVTAARLLNTRSYVETLATDPRYRWDRNRRVPRKIGSQLELFDCITCDKCIPVCPNDANFSLPLPLGPIPTSHLVRDGATWREVEGLPFELSEKHQLANFADFCNDCGNCDVFCPEDGGPYVLKPRFFGTLESWRAAQGDGFHVVATPTGHRIHARIAGETLRLERDADLLDFTTPTFRIRRRDHRRATVHAAPESASESASESAHTLDLRWLDVLDRLAHTALTTPHTYLTRGQGV